MWTFWPHGVNVSHLGLIDGTSSIVLLNEGFLMPRDTSPSVIGSADFAWFSLHARPLLPCCGTIGTTVWCRNTLCKLHTFGNFQTNAERDDRDCSLVTLGLLLA